MTVETRPSPEAIRKARDDNPKMRERDLATQLGISEAEFVAAWVGEGSRRIEPRVNEFLTGMEALGEVMALTRNESAVHEKIGVYDKVVTGDHASMALGEQIDLRIFPRVWAHGFAVAKTDGDGHVRRSLQFFDSAGVAAANENAVTAQPDDLRDRWSKMTDVHQFVTILRDLKLTRQQAVKLVGQDYAWPVDLDAVTAMMHHAAEQEIPIMCFVGNRGCIQIHSGPIAAIKPMGPWLNVMDPTFHLHLRVDHIREAWVVRKPATEGHVTSIEAYDAAGRMIIQFFGKRKEGSVERDDWRLLAENLPRLAQSTAA